MLYTMYLAFRSIGVQFCSLVRVTLFLLNDGPETGGTGVAVEAKESAFDRDRVPVEENEDRWCCEIREEGANGVYYCGDEIDRSAFFQGGLIGLIRRAMLGSNVR